MRLAKQALTFDDVLLIPAFSDILPRDTSLKTRLSRRIALNIPLISAAMDTVTESRLAIAMAQEGGIGIIHKNLSPGEQAAEVLRVKRFESGVLSDPITITPDMTVREVIAQSGAVTNREVPFTEGGRRAGDCTRLVSGSSRAEAELGWRPTRSTMGQMIADAWRWHQNGHYDR